MIHFVIQKKDSPALILGWLVFFRLRTVSFYSLRATRKHECLKRIESFFSDLHNFNFSGRVLDFRNKPDCLQSSFSCDIVEAGFNALKQSYP